METFSLTRYLYPTIEVKQSLLLAILDRELDEALFWTFELFYSNDYIDDSLLDTSTIDYICELYEHFYKKLNPDIESWIQKKLLLIDPAIAVASLVQTLIYRQYSIVEFIEAFLHIKCQDNQDLRVNGKLRILLSQENIIKYATLSTDSPRTLLKFVCRFPIRRNAAVLFNTFIPDNMVNIWFYGWLYYASNTLIWSHRIQQFDGIVNHDTKTVEFDDDEYDENDMTRFELFHNKWNFEPDEQSLELQKRIIGQHIDGTVQMDIRAFCDKYGAHIPTRKLKLRNVLALS
uniref:Uncharacterized protein n=1 Tax=viral metagenome TaxID=1070528 RepID=A0A6C0D5I3_9ZZZZ